MVLSMMAYSLSASGANTLKTLSQKPLFAQRPTAEAGPSMEFRPIAVKRRFDEEAIVLGSRANAAFTRWEQVFNPFLLIVTQAIAAHKSAPTS
jgi:hypothetical protein